MKKLFKITYIIIFVFAIFSILAGKISILGKYFLYEEDMYPGGLYKLCKINEFKEKIHTLKQHNVHSIDDADIITFGDSFFEVTLESESFPRELEKKTKLKVYNAGEKVWRSHYNPLIYLNKMNYQKGQRKYLILETVERLSLARGLNYISDYAKYESGELKNHTKNQYQKFFDKIFDNDDIDYFFKENIIIYPLNKYIKNIRYTLFGDMDERVGLCSKNPKMLFYFEAVEFNKQQ